MGKKFPIYTQRQKYIYINTRGFNKLKSNPIRQSIWPYLNTKKTSELHPFLHCKFSQVRTEIGKRLSRISSQLKWPPSWGWLTSGPNQMLRYTQQTLAHHTYNPGGEVRWHRLPQPRLQRWTEARIGHTYQAKAPLPRQMQGNTAPAFRKNRMKDTSKPP